MTITLNVGSYLTDTAFSPDGRTALVSDGIDSTVDVLSAPAQSLVTKISASAANFSAVAISPTGAASYAADANNNQIYPLNLTNYTAGTAIAVDSFPNMLAFNPTGSQLLVVNEQGNATCGAYGSNGSLSIINAATNSVTSTICLGKSPSGLAVSPVPKIARVTPDSGDYQGNTNVTITGSGFNSGATVTFGSQSALSVTVISSTTIDAVAPPSMPAYSTPTVNVTVTDSLGSSVASDVSNFSYGRQTVYSLNQTSNNVVPILTEASPQTALSSISLSSSADFGAISLDGSTLYVANSSSGNVSVIDNSSRQVTSSFFVATSINSMAISPDSTEALFTVGASNAVIAVSLNTSPPTVYPPVSVCTDPVDVTFSPDGLKAFVVCEKSNEVQLIDFSTKRVKPLTMYGVGNQPVAEAISPDGSVLLVVNANPLATAGSITPIFLGDQITVGSSFPVGKAPDAIAIAPDDSYPVVANSQSDNVSIIDMTTFNIVSTIPVGAVPSSVGVTDFGSFVDVANENDNTVTPINLTSLTAGSPIAVGVHPVDLIATPNPNVVNMTPSEGPATGGNQIVINGDNFTQSSQVRFGSQYGLNVQVVSPTQIVVTPPAQTGQVMVTVINQNGVSTNINSQAYQYSYIASQNQPIGLASASGLSQVFPLSTFSNSAS